MRPRYLLIGSSRAAMVWRMKNLPTVHPRETLNVQHYHQLMGYDTLPEVVELYDATELDDYEWIMQQIAIIRGRHA